MNQNILNLDIEFGKLQAEVALLQAQLASAYAEVEQLKEKVHELGLHSRVIGPSFDAMKDYGYDDRIYYDGAYSPEAK